ncbi:MAG: hypothetical protein FJ271_30695 [Planctomycetes bacterium]|nr:hypothetical protein [Planctomycetota bacterium]
MSTTSNATIHQGMLFQWLRWRMLRNATRVVMNQSRLRVFTIFLCSAFIWGSLFAISLFGFRELRIRWDFPLDGSLMGLVFDVLFVSLSALLIFSTGIILYSSLFSSAETSFLLSLPVSPDQIFAYKFQGAIAFSSWAFVLLASPVLIAYGIRVNDGAPWYFYAVLPLFFFGFVLLPGSLGALICLLLVRFVPRNRKQILLLTVAVVAVLLGLWLARRLPSMRDLFASRDWVDQLLDEISLVRSPFVPAHWIADGLQAAAKREPSHMLFRLALIWANGLFLYVVTAWTASKLYRPAYNRIASGSSLAREFSDSWLSKWLGLFTYALSGVWVVHFPSGARVQYHPGTGEGRLDRAVNRLLFFLDAPTRLMIVKDFRTFRRDPAQWAQVVIFICLIVLYFSNVKWFYEQEIGKPFQNGISLLNLVATCFLMCAYTGRFVFPMLSLEGRKFWILGLLPLPRQTLLWGKFAFSAVGCLLVGEFLVLFSNLMLQTPMHIIAVQMATMVVVAVGLSGLSVGLGACIPNFRESDPSKIAVGFGGTLNLVAGLLMVILVVGLMAGPWHYFLMARAAAAIDPDYRALIEAGGFIAGMIVGLLATIVPLRAGARALVRMEF